MALENVQKKQKETRCWESFTYQPYERNVYVIACVHVYECWDARALLFIYQRYRYPFLMRFYEWVN